jgi:hypothetical protein
MLSCCDLCGCNRALRSAPLSDRFAEIVCVGCTIRTHSSAVVTDLQLGLQLRLHQVLPPFVELIIQSVI